MEESIVKCARFNLEKDKELLELVNQKGLKDFILELYDFYVKAKENKMIEMNEINNKLETVLMELKNKPVYQEPKPVEEKKAVVNEMVKGFMKGLIK